MPSTRSAPDGAVRAEVFDSPAALPACAAPLLGGEGPAGFQATPAWLRATIAAALPEGARPLLLLCRQGESALALYPMQRRADGAIASLTTPYTWLWQPLLAPDLPPALQQAAATAFARWCRARPVALLEAMDPAWPGFAPLLAGLRHGGLRTAAFDHFANWSEDVAGRSWEAYLAARPGALRETLRRKLRRVGQGVRFELLRTQADIDRGIAAYEDVYRRSWKQPEPFPRFSATLLREAAASGALRLGLLWQGDIAVATQYWVVAGGRATVLKLAHDEAYRALSPGTILAALMIRGLIGQERVDMLDFGRGDDPYKQLWTTRRSQRVGLLLADPWHPSGLAALARQALGRLRRRIR